jgi:hypothetical protein
MSVGTVLLVLLETRPTPIEAPTAAIRQTPPASFEHLDALIAETRSAIQPSYWNSIIVHADPAGGARVRQCHFLIRPGNDERPAQAVATDLWRDQAEGRHVSPRSRGWNAFADSIGVCLIGDFSRTPPSPDQFRELVELVRRLQTACGNIPASRVYPYSEIDSRSDSPGRAFPTEAFDQYLRP